MNQSMSADMVLDLTTKHHVGAEWGEEHTPRTSARVERARRMTRRRFSSAQPAARGCTVRAPLKRRRLKP